MTPEQLLALQTASLATAPNAQAKKKTKDHRFYLKNKDGSLTSVGYLNIWNRISDADIAQLSKILEKAGFEIQDASTETAETGSIFG